MGREVEVGEEKYCCGMRRFLFHELVGEEGKAASVVSRRCRDLMSDGASSVGVGQCSALLCSAGGLGFHAALEGRNWDISWSGIYELRNRNLRMGRRYCYDFILQILQCLESGDFSQLGF